MYSKVASAGAQSWPSFLYSSPSPLNSTTSLCYHLASTQQGPGLTYQWRNSQISNTPSLEGSGISTLATPHGLRHRLRGTHPLPQKEFLLTACMQVWEPHVSAFACVRERESERVTCINPDKELGWILKIKYTGEQRKIICIFRENWSRTFYLIQRYTCESVCLCQCVFTSETKSFQLLCYWQGSGGQRVQRGGMKHRRATSWVPTLHELCREL